MAKKNYIKNLQNLTQKPKNTEEAFFVKFLNTISVPDNLPYLLDVYYSTTIDLYGISEIDFEEVELFHDKFRYAMFSFIKTNVGLNSAITEFIGSYVTPEDYTTSFSGDGEFIDLKITDVNTETVKKLVCWSLLMYLKYFEYRTLKVCKICNNFFSIKGKYAVYCSEQCKMLNKEGNNGKTI